MDPSTVIASPSVLDYIKYGANLFLLIAFIILIIEIVFRKKEKLALGCCLLIFVLLAIQAFTSAKTVLNQSCATGMGILESTAGDIYKSFFALYAGSVLLSVSIFFGTGSLIKTLPRRSLTSIACLVALLGFSTITFHSIDQAVADNLVYTGFSNGAENYLIKIKQAAYDSKMLELLSEKGSGKRVKSLSPDIEAELNNKEYWTEFSPDGYLQASFGGVNINQWVQSLDSTKSDMFLEKYESVCRLNGQKMARENLDAEREIIRQREIAKAKAEAKARTRHAMSSTDENDSSRDPDVLDRIAGRAVGLSEEEIREFANDELMQAAKDVAVHEAAKEIVPFFFDKATERKWDKFMEVGDRMMEGK